jgi:protein phosphatase
LRQNLIRIARRYQIPVYLLIMDTPLSICHQRNRNSNIEPLQIEIQFHQTQSISNIATQEGFSHIFSASKFVGNKGLMPLRKTLPIRRKHCSSCDIIGDIHGCFEELQQLLHLLGYRHTSEYDCYNHPADRKAIFLGDIVDRGPNSTAVIDLVIAMVKQNQAIYLPGNHCDKFVRYLQGNNVMINHGLENTLENLKIYDAKAREYLSQQFIEMYEQAPPYLMLDNDKLLVSHAGLPEAFHGRLSNKIRSFALYGDVTGKIDECGRPMRRDWAKEYRGKTLVVYGHTPTLYPRFVNNTINIDQGCVFGGSLSALRYPERELVSIPAKYIYWQPQAQHSQSP